MSEGEAERELVGAGKLMALAAYGKTSQYLEDKLFLDMSKGTMPDYTDNHSCAYNNDEDLSDTGQQNSRNVAAALQGVTERHIKAIYDDLEKLTTKFLKILNFY